MKSGIKHYAIAVLFSFLWGFPSLSAQKKKKEWPPQPTVIQPGKKGKAPSDAVVLFNGGDLNNFVSVPTGGPAEWKVLGKKFTVVPGTKAIQTKQRFGDCQLHIEWKTPPKDTRQGKKGQQNGNSGIYFMGKYEIQVLNSFQNETNPMGQAGAFYGNFPPLVNASLEPGKWQTFDIVFKAPKFNTDEELIEPGSFTVFHNGVLVQHNVPVIKPTAAHNKAFSLSEPELPLMLQDHKNEVSYRNIWIRRL